MTGQKSVLSCGNVRALQAALSVAEKACTAELAENVDDRPPCRGIPEQSASPLRRWNGVW